jgi:hypothetical protein
MIAHKSSKLFQNYFWLTSPILVIAVFSLIPLTLVFPIGDIFSSSLRISSDGFDWIIEGRALLVSTVDPWPVLRNTNLVLLSALDSILGNTGLIFALVNSCGLAMQGAALWIVMRIYKLGAPHVSAILVGYYLLPLHFISLYVLADTVAVGLTLLSTAFFLSYLDERRSIHLHVGTSLALIAGLFQTYGLAPTLVFATLYPLFAWKSNWSRGKHFQFVFSVGLSLVAYLTIRTLWLSSIPHLSVPSQVELLSFGFQMTEFYLAIWFFLFTPLLVTLVISLFMSRPSKILSYEKFKTNKRIHYLLAVTVGLLAVTYFYQWPESRFSYISMAPAYMLIIAILSSKEQNISNSKRYLKNRNTWQIILPASMISFSLLFPPSDFWRPQVSSFEPLKTWVSLSLLDLQPNYQWYRDIRAEACADRTKVPTTEVENILNELGIGDPYTRTISSFALSNCL